MSEHSSNSAVVNTSNYLDGWKTVLGLFLNHLCWLNFFVCPALLCDNSPPRPCGSLEVLCVSSKILLLAEDLAEGASSSLRNLGSFLVVLLKCVPHPQWDHSHVPMDTGHRCSRYYGNASTSPTAPAAAPLIGGTVVAVVLQEPGLGKPWSTLISSNDIRPTQSCLRSREIGTRLLGPDSAVVRPVSLKNRRKICHQIYESNTFQCKPVWK